ncbi:A/G-specific adenine glycosylase [Chryseobacterium sp. A301]
MKTDVEMGQQLLLWYHQHSRSLPWRETKDPYSIWISEIIMQQTRVAQGTQYYERFIERFPTVQELSEASLDEVLLYWKGLGYYSRAINLHKASIQVQKDLDGIFPRDYDSLLHLRGIGKYTAAAIASICFQEPKVAIDGNQYRVWSRYFADRFDVTSSGAFEHFAQLAQRLMPTEDPGGFNQAVMDLGSSICKPQNPNCIECPLNSTCLAYAVGSQQKFPVKSRKVKVGVESLRYYFVYHEDVFLVRQRDESSIWKRLYEFPQELPESLSSQGIDSLEIRHQLSHRTMSIRIHTVKLNSQDDFKLYSRDSGVFPMAFQDSNLKSFPRPLDQFIKEWAKNNQIGEGNLEKTKR